MYDVGKISLVTTCFLVSLTLYSHFPPEQISSSKLANFLRDEMFVISTVTANLYSAGKICVQRYENKDGCFKKTMVFKTEILYYCRTRKTKD